MATALASTPRSRYTIVPAREVFVSTTMRHQIVGVTAHSVATGREYGQHPDTIGTGGDALANDVPWSGMPTGGRLKHTRPLTNDLEGLHDSRADRKELDNAAIQPRYQQRLEHVLEVAAAELREDAAGLLGRMPVERQVGLGTPRKDAR